jgi:hypothetical protein
VAANPNPKPFLNPRVLEGAALCIRAAAVRELAGTVADPLRTQLHASSEHSIRAIVDDFCGVPSPPLIRSPWPVPSVLALELAAVLAVYANTRAQAGGFRTEIMKIAGRLTEKAFATV